MKMKINEPRANTLRGINRNVSYGLLCGLLILTLAMNSSAAVYSPNNISFTSSVFPSAACSWEAGGLIYFGEYMLSPVGAGTPCSHGVTPAIGYSFIRFSGITPTTEVLLNCTVNTYCGVGGGAGLCDNSSNPLMYRIYGDWNNDTLTWNNQPSYCDGPTCWNVYGGIEPSVGHMQSSNVVRVVWDLTGNDLYGGVIPDLENVSIFFAETNGSEISESTYLLQACYLQTSGILLEQSDVTLYGHDNYGGISNLLVQISNLDRTSYIYKTTDANGYASFTIPYGTYNIDAEFTIFPDIFEYSSTFTADQPNETINVYFNTVGPGTIGGFVYWPNGTGAPLAVVNVTSLEDGTNYATFTEPDGQYLISPIIKGNYTIQAHKAGMSSELSTFTCTGDDSINLNLQAGLSPPDEFSYHILNITTYYSIGNLLPEAVIEIFGLSGSCTYSCFLTSECRNSLCARLISYPLSTDDNGNAIVNRMPPNQPIFNEMIIYGHKAGYQDDDAVLNLAFASTNQSDVNLYLFRLQNTSITFHELNSLQNVYVRVLPNIGAPQVGYTDAGGNITFSFPAVISDLIMNATINNVNYDPYNFIYTISGNPVYIAFQMPNRTITSFNLEGYLFDDVGNNVSGASVELRCASCTPSGSCGHRTTDQDGRYYWWNVPYQSFCLMHATPPTGLYSDAGWLSVYPQTPNTYFNMSPGLIYNDGNVTAGTVFLKLLVTDSATGEPILDGSYDYIVNGTDGFHGVFTHTGYVYIRNLIPGGNVSLLLEAPNYEDVSYFMPVGSSNYEANDRLSMRWIGGATTRPTTTRWDQSTFPTTTLPTTTTTVLFIPEDIVVYEMANESEYILDTIWNAGTACFGAMLLLAPAAAAFGLIVAVLFGMKFIDALLPRH